MGNNDKNKLCLDSEDLDKISGGISNEVENSKDKNNPVLGIHPKYGMPLCKDKIHPGAKKYGFKPPQETLEKTLPKLDKDDI